MHNGGKESINLYLVRSYNISVDLFFFYVLNPVCSDKGLVAESRVESCHCTQRSEVKWMNRREPHKNNILAKKKIQLSIDWFIRLIG